MAILFYFLPFFLVTLTPFLLVDTVHFLVPMIIWCYLTFFVFVLMPDLVEYMIKFHNLKKNIGSLLFSDERAMVSSSLLPVQNYRFSIAQLMLSWQYNL